MVAWRGQPDRLQLFAGKNSHLIVGVNYYRRNGPCCIFTTRLCHAARRHSSYPCKLAITVEISVPPLMRAWVNTICSEYLSIRNLNPSVGNFIPVRPLPSPARPPDIAPSVRPRARPCAFPSQDRPCALPHAGARFPITKFNRHDGQTR